MTTKEKLINRIQKKEERKFPTWESGTENCEEESIL